MLVALFLVALILIIKIFPLIIFLCILIYILSNPRRNIRILKPTLKKVFLSLILLISTGFIEYLLMPLTDAPPFFGFPFPFYCFGGKTLIGFVPPHFDFLFFIIDIILWYISSCFSLEIIKIHK